jgi:hypothetical protein
MAEPSLIEIFDLCIERLAAGDTVEDCLNDYPAVADELRGMLETSALIFQAQADTDDEKQAQAHTRTRIEAALQTDFAPRKGKNSMFTIRRSVIWVGGTAAAIFAFTFGFAFAMTSQESLQPNVVADSSLPDFDRDGLSNMLESDYRSDPNNADSDNDGLIDGDEVRVWATNPLLADSDYDGWSDGDEVGSGTNPTSREEMDATATVIMPQPTVEMLMMLPTATRGLSLPTEAPTLAPLGTSAPLIEPHMSGAGADTAVTGPIVSTSVAGYVAETPPPPPPSSSTSKDKDATGSADKPLLAEPERERTDADTDEYSGEGRTVSDGLLGGVSGGGGDMAEAPVMPVDGVASTVVTTYGTTGSEINATIVLSQEQLNPMKAGEIDDNAEWDTYMEFRHNFEDTYGTYGIIDMDVAGRRIIKIVDATGQPILGARVVVTAPNFSVETRTYATGMTLFFPNADESTKRLDEFKVIVTYDQYQAYYTLNLRKVGDVVEIQMPIVIVRDSSANAANNAAEASRNATAAAENAAEASKNATTAAENAVEAAKNATAAAENAASNDMVPPPADVYLSTPTPAFRTGDK